MAGGLQGKEIVSCYCALTWTKGKDQSDITGPLLYHINVLAVVTSQRRGHWKVCRLGEGGVQEER